MADIPDDISKLTNSELRNALIKVGIKPTPLTPTTRRIYERKLAKSQKHVHFSNEVDEETYDSDTDTSDSTDVQQEQNTAPKENHLYYVVHVPSANDTFDATIYEDKRSAWIALRKNKFARFQQFASRSEAEECAQAKRSTKVPSKTSTNDSKVNERVNNLPVPKQAELNELMKVIADNDIDVFDKVVWDNPRFLINTSDCPVTLKPSTRYNALHIAARANVPEIVKRILATIENEEFHKIMYANIHSSSENNFRWPERINHLLDLYLNSQEKGCFETPLHIACKFGFVEVVEELVAHPMCDKAVKNKFQETAADVACSRSENSSMKSQILNLLKDQYYIPVIRSHDDSQRPVVGQPRKFTSTLEGFQGLVPPSRTRDPIDPVLVVSALAGPMMKNEAESIQQRWSTPNKKEKEGLRMTHIRLSDVDRGEERIGRELFKGTSIPWLEYWDFLHTYADFTTDDGLSRLEKYLSTETKNRSLPDDDVPETSASTNDSLDDLCSQMNSMNVSSKTSESLVSNRDGHSNDTDDSAWWALSQSINMGTEKSQLSKSSTTADSTRQHLQLVKFKLLKARYEQLKEIPITIKKRPDNSDSSFLPEDENVFVSDSSSLLQYDSDLDILGPRDTPSIEYLSKVFTRMNVHYDTNESNSPNVSVTCTSTNTTTRRLSTRPNQVIRPIFIFGSTPSKLDRDVFLAISDTEVSSEKYPHVWKWMKAVLSYSQDERQKWRTPRSSTKISIGVKGTPLRLTWPASPLASKHSTPLKFENNNDADHPLSQSYSAV